MNFCFSFSIYHRLHHFTPSSCIWVSSMGSSTLETIVEPSSATFYCFFPSFSIIHAPPPSQTILQRVYVLHDIISWLLNTSCSIIAPSSSFRSCSFTAGCLLPLSRTPYQPVTNPITWEIISRIQRDRPCTDWDRARDAPSCADGLLLRVFTFWRVKLTRHPLYLRVWMPCSFSTCYTWSCGPDRVSGLILGLFRAILRVPKLTLFGSQALGNYISWRKLISNPCAKN